jgi:type VI secretion system secreted protein Hcp
MAESISLTISSNGTNIPGDHPLTSLSRANTIEVLSLEQQLSKTFDRATLMATGRRIYAPLRFSKRLDRATPLLRRALTQNEVVAGNFRWYRPNPVGDGTTEQFFTLTFTGGRITKCTLRLPDTLLPDTSGLPPLEDIELTFSSITWTWVGGGIEHTDTLSSST